MASSGWILLLGVALGALFLQSDGLSCYVCQNAHETCSNKDTCPSGLGTCVKATTSIPFKSSTHQRFCSNDTAVQCSEKNTNILGQGFHYNCCFTDNCNSASTSTISLTTMALVLMVFAANYIEI